MRADAGDVAADMTKIGVISDTHGLMREEALAALEECELIVHAGDIGSPQVIAALERLCPVRAIRGNVDRDAWADTFSQRALIDVAGRRIYVIHNLKELDLDPVASGLNVVICGHSHVPKCEEVNGVLYLNPGSAGPRRFSLPVTVATLCVSRAAVSAQIHHLAG